MSLRCGITTGACAAAAAKAAVTVLAGGAAPREIDLCLPSGQSIRRADSLRPSHARALRLPRRPSARMPATTRT